MVAQTRSGEGTDLLQAETLRKDDDDDDDEAGGLAGDGAFRVAGSFGEAPWPSGEDSSRARLRPVIRAHGRARAGWGELRCAPHGWLPRSCWRSKRRLGQEGQGVG